MFCTLCSARSNESIRLVEMDSFKTDNVVCPSCAELVSIQLEFILSWGRRDVQRYANKLAMSISSDMDAYTAQIVGLRLIACASVRANLTARDLVEMAKAKGWTSEVVLEHLNLAVVQNEAVSVG